MESITGHSETPQERATRLALWWNGLEYKADTMQLRADMAAVKVELAMIAKNYPDVTVGELKEYENGAHDRSR
jgi:hypothetical protein